MLDEQGGSFEDMVIRLADRLIQSMNNSLVLHHNLRRSLQMSEAKSHKVVFLYPGELGDDP